MEGMELVCFEIITAAGSAKSCYMEALQFAKNGQFEEAQKSINEGDSLFLEGHRIHSELVAQEARGEAAPFSLLLMHAEDQSMSTELIKTMVTELIELYKNK